ncbi:MAG: undecaprenyl-diphosphate phosphatase [Phycisphaerales bacterium]|nr:undecaprenyl-diphosphate phosphatase [Phycisphaerales bacterium]
MNVLEAAVLGLVEGVTEYLPISSTGHLILTSWLLGLDDNPLQREAIKKFEIIVQGGAILAVVGLYRARLLQILRGFGSLAIPAWRCPKASEGLKLGVNLMISSFPAAVLGLLLRGWIKEKLFSPVPVLLALFVGGVVMIALAPWHRRRESGLDAKSSRPAAQGAEALGMMSARDALLVGALQCLALWPGMSRSMTTIVGGMLAGLPAKSAAEYSFLLALPVLGGACLLESKDALEGGVSFVAAMGGAPSILVGLLVATVSAALAVRWLVSWLSRSTLAIFGVWRIVLAVLLGAAISAGWVTIAA